MIISHTYTAPAPGPKLLIFGAIHGNEPCGPLALQKLKDLLDTQSLSLLRGTLVFVPVCNPKAHLQKLRFTEENLNRVFYAHKKAASYEQKLANELLVFFENCDYFLDLHSMQSEGDPFVFLNKECKESENFCEALGLEWIMSGWPDLYKNIEKDKSSCTQSYADSLGIPNALVECGQHNDPNAPKVALDCIFKALSYLEMIHPKKEDSFSKPKKLRLEKLFFRESKGDRFTRPWKNFEKVNPGDVLLERSHGELIRAEKSACMVFPSPDSQVGTEIFYLAQEDQKLT